jgi:hypothetical protein
MRRVKVFGSKYFQTKSPERYEMCKGIFHQFATDYEQFTSEIIGQYPCAIVECIDGTIITPHVKDIQFMDEYS